MDEIRQRLVKQVISLNIDYDMLVLISDIIAKLSADEHVSKRNIKFINSILDNQNIGLL